jgi:glycosyltransferase involved in cell wall biosynthesis
MKKVSIVIPCKNEEQHIETCILSLLNNGYPEEYLEIIVVDGMSNDRTHALVINMQQQFSCIKWVENQHKKTPFALNLGIQHATGDYILIASAHSSFDTGYISVLLQKMEQLQADVVGGMMRTQVKRSTVVSNAIQQVLSHRFGVGNSMFRVGVEEDIAVDTVPFGLYKTTLLRSVGGYNEQLIRNHDMELSKRLLAKGARIFLTPDAQCTYYARETKWSMAKNNYDNGKWNMLTVYITRDFASLSLRHFIPLLFVLSLLLPAILAFIYLPFLVLSLCAIAAYSTVLLWVVMNMERKGTTIFQLLQTFVTLHLAYGMGSLVGLLHLNKLVKR